MSSQAERTPTVRVLLLEGNPADVDLVSATLRKGWPGCELTHVETRGEFIDALRAGRFDVILADYAPPSFDAMSALAITSEQAPDVPFILVSGMAGEEIAIEALKAGATDYVLKQRLERLVPAVRRALRESAEHEERRRIEQALRESQEQFRLLVDGVRDYAIFSLDPEGRISSWNKGAERITAYGQEEIVGRHFSVLFSPEDIAARAPERELSAAAAEGRCTNQGWRVRKDGSRFWAEGVLTALPDEAGKPRGFAKVMRDSTERRRAEEERLQLLAHEREARRQAQTVNRTKDEFLATVSHELRTPLTALLGWAQMLRSERLDHETAQRGLELVERNSKLLAQLVEDLLDVSRIITGKLRLNVRTVDMESIVRTAVDAFRPGADAKGIRLELALEKESCSLQADPDRLQQVAWNLLSNAIKFTDEGGRIVVRLERAGAKLEFSVRDTGQGIDPAFLPYVFDRFRQADGSNTRAFGGLGLGLAIVRYLVELHGGTVHAESAGKGQGAEFRVELPLHPRVDLDSDVTEPGTSSGRAPTGSPSDLEGIRVLVVEDDRDTLDMLRVALEHYGAQVTAVASAAEAMGAMRSVKPHAVVSDIGLQGENGYSLIRRIRMLETELGRGIAALALTGLAREEDRERVLESGFQAHVTKPVEPAALARAVAKLVRSRNDQELHANTP